MIESQFIDRQEAFTGYLFNTLEEGLLVLDYNLCVKKANSSYFNHFQAQPCETEGKSLYELGGGHWDIPALRRLLEKVLPEQKTIKGFQIEHTFEKIGYRVLLLNARQIDHLEQILVTIQDITEREIAMQEVVKTKYKLEKRIEERSREVRRLASKLTEVEQQERSRIADVLHDDLQQKLFAIRMNLNILHNQMVSQAPDNPWSVKVSDLIASVDQAFEKTRQLSSDLNPSVLKSEQLSEMLGWLTKRFDQMYNLKTDLQAEAGFRIHDQQVRVILIKIVRELLFNIVKHAGTDQAMIKVNKSTDDHMIIDVMDEGSGFDPDKIDHTEHFGLFGIRDRLNIIGGDLEIDSDPGSGTHMIIDLPVGETITAESAPNRSS